MADKDKLETQINGFGEILAQIDNVVMNGTIIDAEGFPRNDIDVYEVRRARQIIICLQKDHKGLMKEIEELLHQLHADVKEAQTSQQLSHKTTGMNLNGNSTE